MQLVCSKLHPSTEYFIPVVLSGVRYEWTDD
jgi:hypothetical protein